MDTTSSNYNYPQLFDIQQDESTAQFDTDLFHGLILSDNHQLSPSNRNMYINNNFIDKKLSSNNNNTSEDIYNSLAGAATTTNNNSYLQYLQSNNTSNNDYFYDITTSAATQHQMMMMNIPPTMDIVDYDYFNTGLQQSMSSDQKQQYNWLYDPIDTFFPNNAATYPHHQQQQQQKFFGGDDSFVQQMMSQQHLDSIMSDHINESITVEGGMSRGYVSLSDVNSFVAKADSMKHSCLLQMPNDLMTDFSSVTAQQQSHQCCSSSESTNNEDSDDDYSDSETELRWPMLNTSYSTPTTTTTSNAATKQQNKLMIKIKKPSCSSNHNASALPTPYGEHPWSGFISPKTSKSANTQSTVYKAKYRKSMSNIFSTTAPANKKKNKLLDNSKRRGSAPHRLTINHSNYSTSSLGSLHSSSSLSSLSNNLQRSMRVSDSMNSFLSTTRQHSSDEENAVDDEEDNEEEDDDDEYQMKSINASSSGSAGGSDQLVTKKGRNVDKACNHCKRSHLRCDDMRPCRRCVSTGKTGCKDVQHKPRGRPKLHKK